MINADDVLDFLANRIREEKKRDIIEVVRCKDCLWWNKPESPDDLGRCSILKDYTLSYWYCGDAVIRRDDDE